MIKDRDVSTGATGTILVASKQGGRFCTSSQRLHQGVPVVTSLKGQYICKLMMLTIVFSGCLCVYLYHMTFLNNEHIDIRHPLAWSVDTSEHH